VTLYADANAILKLYVEEADSDKAEAILRSDPDWITGFHTLVEVRRNLRRVLDGAALLDARQQFDADWDALRSIELDERICTRSAELAESTGVRSLDALHLGTAASAGADEGLLFVTFDRALATAARSLGWTVFGAQ
jgi:predicted nucleic acid-binding protein